MVAKAATKAGEFFCFHCGKQVTQDDYGCRGCGSEFDRIVKAFRCPRCARILPVGAVVCPACGLGFKIRNVNSTKQLTQDEELLVELIDWGKQPEAPFPESVSSSGQIKDGNTSEATKGADDLSPKIDGLKSSPEQIPPEISGASDVNNKDGNLISDRSPGAYSMPDAAIVNDPQSNAVKEHNRKNDNGFESIRTLDIHPMSRERVGDIGRTDFGSNEVAQQPRRPVFGDQLASSAHMPQEHSVFKGEGRREGLSNQVLKKLLEEREREVNSLKSREDEIARREAHLERRIKDYAAKRRELDNLRKQVVSPEQIPHRDDHEGEPIDPPDFPSDLAVDDRDSWLKEQSRIKMGLIEIRNEMGSRDDMMDYYPPPISGDVLAKMEALEERIMDVSRDREEISARLKRMEACMVDTRNLLKVLDQLLGQLPPEVIDEFSKSKEFKLYEKVLDDLKI